MDLKKIFILAPFVLSIFFSNAQEQELKLTKKDSIIESAWIVELGTNVVYDAGDEFNNFFDVEDKWNIVPFPSRLAVGRYLKGGFMVMAVGTYNKYKEGKIIDGAPIAEDVDYYAFDVLGTYDLNGIIGETGFFDPYIGVGTGYTNANDFGRGTFNTVLGSKFWINDNWGIDLNANAKFSLDGDMMVSNHLQYAASVAYRFGVKKKLSKKGEAKAALIEEQLKEQQRIQDSIAAAQKAEAEALAKAKELERLAEEKRLAEEEKARIDAENKRKAALDNLVNGVGHVYYSLNSSYLNSNDKEVLEALKEVLEANETMEIKAISHSDARGESSYNLWLSERRLEKAIKYLVSLGVDVERVKGEAVGEEKPNNECGDNVKCPEDKHKENRRIEFGIIKY